MVCQGGFLILGNLKKMRSGVKIECMSDSPFVLNKDENKKTFLRIWKKSNQRSIWSQDSGQPAKVYYICWSIHNEYFCENQQWWFVFLFTEK